MTEITKEFRFSMAHILENHTGLCLNLHGHTYTLFVTATADPKEGMVIDFKDLKKIVKTTFIEKIDHSFGYNKNSKDPVVKEIARILKANGRKAYEFDFRTTSENIAEYVFGLLAPNLKKLGVVLKEVKIYESPESCATYRK